MLIKVFKWSLMGMISIAVVYVGALWISSGFGKDFLSIDTCLDHGGCWDSIDRTCRVNELNAQQLCDRSKPR